MTDRDVIQAAYEGWLTKLCDTYLDDQLPTARRELPAGETPQSLFMEGLALIHFCRDELQGMARPRNDATPSSGA